MNGSNELVWLINQLRNQPRPRERLRLLALGWRTLRGMSTADKLRVARELGVENGEQIVEELGRRGGLSPSLLLGALRKLKSADSVDMDGLVSGLLDPSRRGVTIARVLEDVEEFVITPGHGVEPSTDEPDDVPEELEEAPAGSPFLVSADAEPETSPFIEAEEEAPEHSAMVSPKVGGAVLAGALAAAAREAQVFGEELARDDDADEGGGPDAPPALLEERQAPEPEPEPELELEEAKLEVDAVSEGESPDAVDREDSEDGTAEKPVVEEATQPQPVEEPPEEVVRTPFDDRDTLPAVPAAPVVAADIDGLSAELAAATSMTGRLRILAERAPSLEDATTAQLLAIVDGFGPDWARRRALESLLRAGVPRSLKAALELASTLERRSERMWALTTLAATRELDFDEVEQLLDSVESPVIRRRLEQRLRIG